MAKNWEHDLEFKGASKLAKQIGRIVVGEHKSFMAYQFAKQARNLPGDVAEFGVFMGATAKLIAYAVKGSGKKVHLFDTFEGLPQPTKPIDIHNKGEFNVPFDKVEAFFQDTPEAVFHKGFFPDTTKGLEELQYSFVHIDADLYQSTLDGFDYFYPRMCKGGIILLDDYEWPHTPGVKKAVEEWMKDKPERIIVSSLDHQAFIIKV